MIARIRRLLEAGFPLPVARALAARGYDVVDWWPVGWSK